MFIVSQDTNFAMKGFLGFLMRYADEIPVSKDKDYMERHFYRTLNNLLVNKKEYILIYPEQEMWFNYRKPRPPKRGAYFYAAKFNVPIISCFVEMKDMDKDDTEEFKRVKYVLHILDPIYPDPEKKTKHYSLGMKQRLGIALALVGDPDLLILDEPINGLDPQGIVEVRETIQKLAKERGMTICISSHILEELSKIATDYGIIHNGCLVQELTREELMKKCSERIELTLDNPKQAIPVLDDMGFSSYQVIDKEHIHIFERLGESASLNMELAKAGIPVKGISITSEELENYFLRLTGGDNRA